MKNIYETLADILDHMFSCLCFCSLLVTGVSTAYIAHQLQKVIDGDTIKISEVGSINQSAHKEFSWDTYLDPTKPEFWDDGNGQPPRPFRHVASFPTKENIANLKKWTKLQEEKITEVTTMIGTEDIKNLEETISDIKRDLLSDANPSDKRRSDGKSQIDIVYVYSTTCSACKAAKEVVARLKAEGVKFTMLQSDYEGGLEADAIPYTKEYRELFPASVTPTFYIKVGNFEAAKIEGFKPYRDFVAAIASHITQELKKKS